MTYCALVTGCAGQDGSYLTKSLLSKGYRVVGTSRNIECEISNHKKLNIFNEFEIVQCSLNSVSNFRSLVNRYFPDEIYHLSAQSSVGQSFNKPLETFGSIVNTTSTILEVCRDLDFAGRIFFAGSSEMFGETKEMATISSPIKPISPYGLAKYQSLLISKMYKDIYKLNTVNGILFNHESPLRGNNFVTHKIVNGALECLKNRNFKIKLGNIDIYRDWGWAEEYVEAIQLITRSRELENSLICTGEIHSLKEFAKLTFSKIGLNYKDHIEYEKKYSRPFEIHKSQGNPSPLNQKTGWEAKIKFNKVIDLLIEEKLQKLPIK